MDPSVESSMSIIDERGGRVGKGTEPLQKDLSLNNCAWTSPISSEHKSVISSSGVIVDNMKDVLVWRLQRACGIAPIRLAPLEGSSTVPKSFFVDGSFHWAVYSIALIVFVLPMAFGGPVNDYFNALKGHRITRMETDTDIVITFFDITTVVLASAVSIGYNVYRKKTILCLLKQLVEIDVLLNWQGPKRMTRWPIIILIVLVCLLFLDIMFWAYIGSGFTLTLPYFPFYFSYFILFAEEAAFVNDSTSLDARFRRLNSQLTASVTYADNGFQNQPVSYTVPRIYIGGEVSSIRRLSVAHARLCEATQTACRRHGVPILVDVMGTFLHLVITAYFFITQFMIKKGSPSAPYQVIQGLWVLAHFLRLVQIVVPCSETTKEASRTGVIVGRLLNTAISPATSKQLEFFAIQLMHSNANFSACGFFTLDLPLVVSVMAAVTTYLVVLIQIKVPSSFYPDKN